MPRKLKVTVKGTPKGKGKIIIKKATPKKKLKIRRPKRQRLA